MRHTLQCSLENEANHGRQVIPDHRFGLEMRPPLGGEFVKLGFTSGLRRLPSGGKQPYVFETVESGIERVLLDPQSLAGHLLKSLCDGITVNAAKRNKPDDEEIERTPREIESVFSLDPFGFYIYASTCRRSRYIEYGVCC
jgi:hypothetical protein